MKLEDLLQTCTKKELTQILKKCKDRVHRSSWTKGKLISQLIEYDPETIFDACTAQMLKVFLEETSPKKIPRTKAERKNILLDRLQNQNSKTAKKSPNVKKPANREKKKSTLPKINKQRIPSDFSQFIEGKLYIDIINDFLKILTIEEIFDKGKYIYPPTSPQKLLQSGEYSKGEVLLLTCEETISDMTFLYVGIFSDLMTYLTDIEVKKIQNYLK